jgi:hypothetical protein
VASFDSGDSVWSRTARYMRLASQYGEMAGQETDPEARANLLHTVVQLLALAAAATDAEPASSGAKGERTVFIGRPQKRARPQLVRKSAPRFLSVTKTTLNVAKLLKGCRASELAPHPARGLLPMSRPACCS